MYNVPEKQGKHVILFVLVISGAQAAGKFHSLRDFLLQFISVNWVKKHKITEKTAHLFIYLYIIFIYVKFSSKLWHQN